MFNSHVWFVAFILDSTVLNEDRIYFCLNGLLLTEKGRYRFRRNRGGHCFCLSENVFILNFILLNRILKHTHVSCPRHYVDSFLSINVVMVSSISFVFCFLFPAAADIFELVFSL